jgi:hypothetical protein
MILMEPALQPVLHDSLPHHCIKKMKESNQQLIRMKNYATLREFALNIEEASRNPGNQSDNDEGDKGSSPKSKSLLHPQEEESRGRK